MLVQTVLGGTTSTSMKEQLVVKLMSRNKYFYSEVQLTINRPNSTSTSESLDVTSSTEFDFIDTTSNWRQDTANLIEDVIDEVEFCRKSNIKRLIHSQRNF